MDPRPPQSGWTPTLVVLGGVAIVLLGCGACYLPFLFLNPCGNEPISESVSPDGLLRAVSFSRDCGATTGFSTQVSLLPAKKRLPNEGGNILVVDGLPQLKLHWLNNRQLQITGAGLSRTYLREDSFGEIHIIYE